MPREECKGTVVIETPIEEVPVDTIIRILFGKSMQDFVKELKYQQCQTPKGVM